MRFAVVSLVFFGFWSSAASAEETRPIPAIATNAGLASIFYVLDCINEGFTSADEVAEHGGVLYRRMDLDRSGRVSRAEYLSFASEKEQDIRAAFFEEMDKDGDGEITTGQYKAHVRRMVDQADVNQDGVTHWEEVLYLRGEAALPVHLQPKMAAEKRNHEDHDHDHEDASR
ncbi:MAG: hypothetical protein AAF221_10580 [Pseudomonadota bacterium]